MGNGYMKFFAVAICALWANSASAALLDSLEVYYNFDNDTATVGGIADASGNGRTASPFDNNGGGISGVGFSSTVPAAIGTGNSLSLAGADSLRADVYQGIAGSGPRTISMWVKTNVTTLNQVFAEWGTNSTGARFGLRMEEKSDQSGSKIGGIRTEINGDYRTTAASETAMINDNLWHHIATVYTGTTGQLEDVSMYIDGVLVSVADLNTSTPVNTMLSTNKLSIGSRVGVNTNVYSGLMDEVGIWSRALSPAEIGQLASGAVPIPEPTSIAAGLLVLGGALLVRRRKRTAA